MFSEATGYVTTLTIKEACFKSQTIKGFINHMKYSVIPSNHNVITLAYVANVCPDLLKPV